MEDFIKLKKRNTLKIGIKDEEGKPTGEHLEFDIDNIDYLLQLNKADILHNKNIEYLKGHLVIINKKQDKKGKYILSSNEEEKIKLMQEFYKREMEALDLFLGEGACKKLLNGNKPYIEMFDDFKEMLEPIMPLLHSKTDDIIERVKKKYSKKEEIETLE